VRGRRALLRGCRAFRGVGAIDQQGAREYVYVKTGAETLDCVVLTALKIDCSGGDRGDALWILFKEIPCAAAFNNDVVVVIEDGDREFVAAQLFPDVFDRIEFRSVRWQTRKGDVFGIVSGSDVIAGAIEDEGGVAA